MSSSSDNGNSPTPSNTYSERLLTEEELEPYVRRKKNSGDSKKRLQGMNEEEQNVLRTSINSRERRRMHDLNDAMEELRSVLPYKQDANSRRMSKVNTLLLASNWIRSLTSANEKLTKELSAYRATGKEDRPPTKNVPPKSESSTDHPVPGPLSVHQNVSSEDKSSLRGLSVPSSFPSLPFSLLPLPLIHSLPQMCRRSLNQPCNCVNCFTINLAQSQLR